jgi:hypothetical protein
MPGVQKSNAGLAEHEADFGAVLKQAQMLEITKTCLLEQGQKDRVVEHTHVVLVGPPGVYFAFELQFA